MKFKKEFFYCMTLVVFVILLYAISSFASNVKLQLLLSIFNIIIGPGLVILGFWGSDFAFAMASGQLHQENVKGKFKGRIGKVYVPFMKNYSALEWWNLNWFITSIGVFLTALGTFVLGTIVGTYIF